MSEGQKPRHKVIVAFDLVIKVEVAIRTRREICIASHRSKTMSRSAHLRCLLMCHGRPRPPPSPERFQIFRWWAFLRLWGCLGALAFSQRRSRMRYVNYVWTAAPPLCAQRNSPSPAHKRARVAYSSMVLSPPRTKTGQKHFNVKGGPKNAHFSSTS